MLLSSIIPTPKRVTLLGPGTFLPARVPGVIAWGAGCGIAPAWLADKLGTTCRRHQAGRRDKARGAIRIGLLRVLAADGAAPASLAESAAFVTPAGRKQGYLLTIAAGGILLGALHPAGLLNGAASLLQVFQQAGPGGELPCGRIEDWPDFEYRTTDWLLNLEINRWGYERADGRVQTLERMKRKLDLAAAFKLNVIWFDGFGWRANRAPDYPAFVQALSDHARRRHIRLAFGGYGGGYGIVYQKGSMYGAPFHGEVFLNRRSYPAGRVYPCIGHPGYPGSRRYGTCLSNDELLERKLAELAHFVRTCRPGMLYIHDIDAGSFPTAQQGWAQRCPACRKTWPDDALPGDRGLAGAYAAWFRKVVDRINRIAVPEARYRASRDCDLVFVGPVYSSVRDSDERWDQELQFFESLSRLLGPAPNVQFGIREQFVSASTGHLRVAQLSRRVGDIGNGHGVFVVSFVGGDNFYNDQPVSAAASLHRYFEGAKTVYTSGLGALAEPAQLVAAQYAWNAAAPGAAPLKRRRNDALDLVRGIIRGEPGSRRLSGPNGLLMRACERLYGKPAAPWMFRVFTLTAPSTGAACGYADAADARKTLLFPVFCACGFVAGEPDLLAGDNRTDQRKRARFWRRRAALTAEAVTLLDAALAGELPDPDVRGDVAWLKVCAERGRDACRILAAAWRWRQSRRPSDSERFKLALESLAKRLPPPGALTDPAGGDLAVWPSWISKLRAL